MCVLQEVDELDDNEKHVNEGDWGTINEGRGGGEEEKGGGGDGGVDDME
jgi:hypothetical protein